MSPIALGPIADLYRAGRARIEVVNGWQIVAEFDGSAAELGRAREAVGIPDLSHLKKFMALGRGAPAFFVEAG